MEWQESNSNARVNQEIGPFNRTLQDAPVQQVPYDWSAVGADNGTSPPAAVAQQPLSGTPYVAATQTVLSAPQAALSAVGLNVAQLCTANVVPGSVGHVAAACATLSNPLSVPTANGTGGPGHSPAVAPLRMHSACASNTRSWNASFSVADKPSGPGGMEAIAPAHLASSAAAEQQPALTASSAPTLDPMPQLMQQLAPTALAGLSALQPSLLPAAVAAAVPPPLQQTSAVAQAAAASQAALLQQLQRQLCNLPAAMVQAGLLPLLAQQPLPQRPNMDFAQQQSTPSSISTQQLLPAAVQREPSSSLQPQLGKATPASAGKAQVQHPAMPEFAEPSAAATVNVAAGSADGLSRSKRKAQLPADGSNGGIPERPSAAAAGSSAELPAMLPARLRKKIKIIQPISATWEEEALAKPAVAKQRHEASDAATKATAAAGSIAGVNKETDTGSGRIAADAEPRSGGLLGLDGQDTLLTRGSTNHDLVNGTGLMEQQLQSSRQQPSVSASKAAANGFACGDDADCAGAAGGPAVDYDGSSSGAGGLSSGAEGSGSDGGEVRASNSPKPTQQNSSQPQEIQRTPQQQQQQQEAQGTDGQAAGNGAVAAVSAAAAEASTTPDTAANLKQAVVRLALPTPPPPASAAYSTGGVGAAKQATCRSHSPAAEGNAQIPRPSIAAAMSTAGLVGGQPTKAAQCSAAAADGSEHAAAAGAASTHQAPALHKRAAAVSISTAAASAAFGTADVLQTGIESQEAIAVTDWQAADAGNGNGIDVADGAKSDGDNVALSEQDSSEGESEGEEPNDDLEQQCQQQQLRDLGLPAAQQQVIRSPAGTLAAPAAAGAVPLVQGAAGVAGLNSSAAAAVLSNQLAAVQAILAAGLAGRQGMGILNQGLNLWSHVQGTGQAGLQGLGASAAAAAAAMMGTPAAAGNAATIPAAAAAPAAALQKDGSGPGAAPAAAVPALANAGLPPALAHLLGVSSNPSVHAAVAVGPTGVPDSPAANLAAVLQQLQNPVPPSSASDGPLNMSSVSAQLGMLYSWYASNRAAYLEQVQVLLQLAERDRLMAAALGPVAASAAARPPALRALDKALEIIRGSHALEQYCRTTSAATTTATTGSVGGCSHIAAAATGGGGGHPTARVGKVGKTTTAEPAAAAAAGMSTDPLAPVSVIRPAAAAAAAGLPQQTSAAPPGPGAAAAAAAAALAAMLQQANPATAAAAAQNLLSPAAAMTAAGTSPHALPGSTVNPMVQLQQQLLQHQQHLQAPLAQLQQAVLGSGVNPLLQLAQLARIQQQQQQQQQQAAALLAPLAALAATPGQQSAPMAAAAGGSALNMKQQLGLNNQLTHQQQQQQAPAVKAPGSSAATFNKMPQLPQPVAAAVPPAVLAAALANTPAGQTLPAAAGGFLQSKVGAATPAHMMAAAGGSGICGVPTDASKQAAHLSTAAAAPGVNGMLQGWANVAVHLPVPSPAGGTTAAVATASAEAQQQHWGSANGRPPVPLVSKLGAATAAHQHQLTQSVAARAAAAAAVTAEASEAGQLKPA